MLDRKFISHAYIVSDSVIILALGTLFAHYSPASAVDLYVYFSLSVATLVLLYVQRVYRLIIRDNWAGLILILCRTYVALFVGYVLFVAYYFIAHDDNVFTEYVPFLLSLSGFLLIISRSVMHFLGGIAYDKSIGLENRKKLLVIGSGEDASFLARGLLSSNEYKLVAFVTDDIRLIGSYKYGVEIKSIADIHIWAADGSIDLVWVTSEFDVEGEFVAKIRESIGNSISIKPFSRLSFDDPVTSLVINDGNGFNLDDFLLSTGRASGSKVHHGYVKGSAVIVTGGGGSIGSTIVKEILRSEPSVLIILDNSEFALYQLQEQLESEALDLLLVKGMSICDIKYILGDIKNLATVKSMFQHFDIDFVFHAAAYKHVPLVEANKWAAFENNVIGTYNLVACAIEFEVKRFVLVSSDKAVRPTNFMGVTKRLAELIVNAPDKPQLGQGGGRTVFSAVRFGNVIGSSGSVLPKFLSQIRSGGPVTVTHVDVERFFMSISEASKLVITAGGISVGGEIFLLDMGEPINIYTLAQHLIQAHGFEVASDDGSDGIAIKVIGLRPGEKLYEELLIQGDSKPSQVPGIFYADEPLISWPEIKDLISNYEFSLISDSDLIRECSKFVPEYVPYRKG